MSDKTGIEWTDATWNPVVGCTHVSAGCDNCYAAREASGRLSRHAVYDGLAVNGRFTGEVRMLENRIETPLRWRRPRMVFVNSMSDLFHPGVKLHFLARVFAVMALARRHTFQVLTKRPERAASLLARGDFQRLVWMALAELDPGADHPDSLLFDRDTGLPIWPLTNVWLGTSVEDWETGLRRVPAILEAPAAVHWLSIEPLLNRVHLKPQWIRPVMFGSVPPALIDWVVVGGESGPRARPMHPDWARSLRDQCQEAGVPFLFKQWGEWAPIGPLYAQGDDEQIADEARMAAVYAETIDKHGVVQLERNGFIADGYQPGDDRTWLMERVGKKAAGRMLDGRTWDQYPTLASS